MKRSLFSLPSFPIRFAAIRASFALVLSACAVASVPSWSSAQDPQPARPTLNVPAGDASPAAASPPASSAPAATAPAATPAGTSTPPPGAGEAPTEAEQAVQLQRSIGGDEKRLKELQTQLAAPDGEYPQAEKEFNRLDAQWSQRKDALELAKEKKNAEDEARLEAEIAKLMPTRAEALQRYELALKERKLLQGNIQTLEEKIAKNKQTLEKITSVTPPTPEGGAPATPSSRTTGEGKNGGANGKPKPKTPPAAGENGGAKNASTGAPVPSGSGSEGAGKGKAESIDPLKAVLPGGPVPPPAAATTSPEKEPKRKEVVEAEAKLQASEREAAQAETAARDVEERIKLLHKNLEVERELKAMLDKRATTYQETLKNLRGEQARLAASGTPTGDLPQKIAQAEQRFNDAQNEFRRLESNVRRLEDELQVVLQQRGFSTQTAEAKRQAAEAERRRLEWLTNPLAFPSVWNWLRDRGPRIIGILAVIAFVAWVGRLARGLVGRILAQRGLRGTKEERENRAKTIMGVFHNASNLLVYGLGSVLLLEEAGISVAPLVGGVAVVGVAVAFGAQNLIKDYFTGFMILLEQQYLVNDIVKIGALQGQVESITLRMTCLRDTDGSVHFIPHGQITQVTNLTHGWSRAVIDVSIGLRDDVDRALEVLVKIGAELRLDDKFGRLILEDADVQGVQELAETCVKLRLLVKTRPLQQWAVRREVLKRIKRRFDLEGIACPTPVGVATPDLFPPHDPAAAPAVPAPHTPPGTTRQGVKAAI